MQKKHKRCMRRIIAAALVMLMVSGSVPYQPIAEVFDTAIVASAEGTVTEVSTADELSAALANTDVSVIKFSNDITYDGGEYSTIGINRDLTIDLNGKTLTTGRYFKFNAACNVTVKNGNIVYNTTTSAVGYFYTDNYVVDLTLKNINVNVGSKCASVISIKKEDSKVTLDNVYFYGKTVAYDNQNVATIIGEPRTEAVTEFGDSSSEPESSEATFDFSQKDLTQTADNKFTDTKNGITLTTSRSNYDADNNWIYVNNDGNSFTVSVPDNKVIKTITLSVSGNNTNWVCMDSTSNYGSAFSNINKNTVTVFADLLNDRVEYLPKITKVTVTFAPLPEVSLTAASDLTYNGEAQALITGAATDGKVKYVGYYGAIITNEEGDITLNADDIQKGNVYCAVTPEGSSSPNFFYFPEGYSLKFGDTVLTSSDTIGFYSEDNKFYISCGVENVELTNGKNAVQITKFENKVIEVTEINTEDELAALAWSSDTVPTGTAAGTYTVYYKGDGENYDDTVKSVSVTIAKADPTVTAPTGGTVYYAGSAVDLLTPGTAVGGTMKYGTLSYEPFNVYNEGEVFATAADLPVGYCITTEDDQGFYLPAGFSLKIDGTEYASDSDVKIHFYRSASGYCFTYGDGSSTKYLSTGMDALFLTGQTGGIITANENSTADRINNAIGNGWSETVPTANAVGNYTVYYKVEGDANHNDSAVGSVDVEVKQSTATVKIELDDVKFVVDYMADTVAKNPDGTYTVNAGGDFVIYSNTYATENSVKAFVGDRVQDYIDYNYKRNGVDFNGVKYRYIYTVYIPEDITNGTEVSIKHVHSYGTPYNGENDSASLYTKCETDNGAEAIALAKLKASGEYYYGDTPSYDNDVELYTSEDEDLVIQKGILRFRKKGSNENLTAFEEPGEYVVEATVKVNGTTYSISKEVTYSARPLTDSSVKFYLGDTPLTVADGKITVPANTYTYTGRDQTPAVTVKNTIDGTTTQLTAGTDYTVAGTSAAKNADDYTFTITGKGSFKGTVTVNWSIAKADADITFAAKDNIVYDGKKIDLDDFDVSGANANLATAANTDISILKIAHQSIPTVDTRTNTDVTWSKPGFTVSGYTSGYADDYGSTYLHVTSGHDATITSTNGKKIARVLVVVEWGDFALHGVSSGTLSYPDDGVVVISNVNATSLTLSSNATPYGIEIEGIYVDYVDGIIEDSGKNAGNYNVMLTVDNPDGNGNYKPFTQIIYDVTVNKKEIDCTLNKYSATYGELRDSNFTTNITASANAAQVISGDTVNVTLTAPTGSDCTNGFLNAGTHELTARSSNSNYIINSPSFTVNRKTLTAEMFSDPAPLIYNGKQQMPTFTLSDVQDGNNLLTADDFRVTNPQTNAGTYNATIRADRNYTGQVNKTWTITKADLDSIVVDPNAVAYSGSNDPQKSAIKVYGVTDPEDSTKKLVLTEETDYTLKYFVVEAGTSAPKQYTEEEFVAAVNEENLHTKSPNTYIVVA